MDGISFSSFNPIDYLRTGYGHLTYYLTYSFYIIQLYGWHILFSGILIYYIFTQFLKPIIETMVRSYERYKKRKEDAEFKDSDIYLERMLAQQAYFDKLQEKYNNEAEDYQDKLQEKAHQRNEEKFRKTVKSYTLKDDYNPLMGPGPSFRYRPPKKGKCGGGGCGN